MNHKSSKGCHSLKTLAAIVLFLLSATFAEAQATLNLEYTIVGQTPNTFQVEVRVSKPGTVSDVIGLAALNSVYVYPSSGFTPTLVTWTEAPTFATLPNPVAGISACPTCKLRATQTPVSGGGTVVNVTTTPELYGTMNVTFSGTPAYPITFTPATSGNPSVQAVYYANGGNTPTTITLASGSIAVTSPPLILSSLPVELSELEASAKGTGNLIQWATASERNSQFHIVERSANGIDGWQEIGRKAAAGTTQSEQNYDLTDELPLQVSYYRLKLLDFDGRYEYSKIVNVERTVEDFAVANVFPVPANQKVTLQVALTEAANLDVTVTDIAGRVLQVSEMDADRGLNNLDVDLSQFATGTYFVKIDNGVKQLTERIVKQ